MFSFLKIFSYLFFFYVISLVLLKTYFSIESLKKITREDFKATILYFLLFFLFLLLLPLLFIYIYSKFFIKDTIIFKFFIDDIFKLNLGNYKIGITIFILSIPIVIFIQNKLDKEIASFYPFSKESLNNNFKFIICEIFYFLFYYITWESVFRGFFQNFFLILVSNNSEFQIDNISNIRLFLSTNEFYFLFIGICMQTLISTLYHIGHPKTEIFASFIGGFIFGIISFITNSTIYTIFIHSFLGITTDYFIKKSKHLIS